MYNYIHIPFCRQKCLYCKFALTPRWERFQVEKYLHSLLAEIREFYQDREHEAIESIYFGWGTPSILSVDQISSIIDSFRTSMLSPDIEITLEANPEDITVDFVAWVMSAGVNRLSLGIQTLNIESLRMIGRAEKNHAKRALDILENAGFRNVSVDFILGLPGVASGEIRENIARLLGSYSCIKHVSVYMLEDGVYPTSWKGSSLSHEAYEADFLAIREYLIREGFSHYELSNFARVWFESRHNTAYWTHENYRGFGLSAASYIDGQRFTNASSFSGYYEWKITDSEMLSDEQINLEKIMFWFRTFQGIRKECFSQEKKLAEFIHEGYLREESGLIFLNSTWIFVLDYIMGELV